MLVSVTVIADVCSGATGWYPAGVTAPSADLIKDCNILLSARDQLRGTVALDPDWTTETDIEDWYGVTIETDRVGGIGLADTGMTGSIPGQLGGLSALTVLQLPGNQLTGEIPVELGNLANLLVLFLHNNLLTGRIPAEFADSTQFVGLFSLHLYGNDLETPVEFSVTPTDSSVTLPLYEGAGPTEFMAQVSLTDPGTLWAGTFPESSNFLVPGTARLDEQNLWLTYLTRDGTVEATRSGNSGVVDVEISPASQPFVIRGLYRGDSIPGTEQFVIEEEYAISVGFTLTLTDDAIFYDDETVTFSLSGTGAPGNTDTRLVAEPVTVTVTDNDPLPAVPTFPKPVDVYVLYQGQAVSQVLSAAPGGSGGKTYSISPDIAATPANGLSFDPASRRLSGTPAAAAGTVRYTLTATDGNGDTDTMLVSVTVIADVCSDETETGWYPTGVTTPTADLTKDCNILLSSKDQLRVTSALNWATGTDIETWNLVYLYDDKSRVQALFSNFYLDGSIPEQWGGLSAPASIALTQSHLTGEIPVELGNLDSLLTLDLHGHRLTGQIPAEFAHSTQLPALGNLALYGNSLTTPVDFSVTPEGPLSEGAGPTVFTAQVAITDPGTLWAAGFGDPSAVTADLNLVTGGAITAAGSGAANVVPVAINPASRAFSMALDGTITGDLTFTLTPTGDGAEQDDETVTFSVSGTGAPGGTDTSLAAEPIEVIVQDNDDAAATATPEPTAEPTPEPTSTPTPTPTPEPTQEPAAPGLTLSVSPDRMTEFYQIRGHYRAREVIVTATLTGMEPPEDDTTVTLAYSGTADHGTDYKLNCTAEACGTEITSATEISIAAGQRSGSASIFIVTVVDDKVEGNETIVLTGAASALGLTSNAATVTITEPAPPTGLELSVSTDRVSELGGEKRVSVTVTLTGGDQPASYTIVHVAYSGTAILGHGQTVAPADYNYSGLHRIVIPKGQRSHTVVNIITPVQDDLVEGNETIVLTARAPALGLTSPPATITLTDD